MTDDVTDYTHADFLNTVGKRTRGLPALLHRGRLAGRRGRDPRPAAASR
ncbi:catalase [Streptomyces thinghirensis]|nr:catalase [Streptomyces thinghirensis]